MKRTNDSFVASSEYQVLKLMVLNKDLDLKDLTTLSFPHKKSRILFKAINKLHDYGESINELSLFRECNQADSEFDLGIIRNLLSLEVSESNFDRAYDILKHRSVRSKVAQSLEKVIEHLNSHDDLKPETITSMLYTAQDNITAGQKKTIAKTLVQCLDEYELDLIQRKIGKYYPFFDPFLDANLIKRAAPGQVILIAGATGTGKSVYCLNLINGMINNSSPCMYFSLEMDTESTMDRLLAMRLGLDVTEFYKTGREMDEIISLVQQEKLELEGKPFALIDDPNISLANIVKQIRDFKMRYKIEGSITIYIDLITQVRDFVSLGTRGNLSTAMELAVNKLNGIAKKEGVCFVAIAQMNRDADSTRITDLDELHKLRPTINNIKNSHALGERSRSVLAIFRPKYYAERLFPDNEEVEFMPDHLESQIVKQSMGRVGIVGRYLFNGPQFKLTPIEGVEENAE